MKLHPILLLSCAFEAQLAVSGEAGPDPKALGTTEGILAFCGKLDPSTAEKYQKQIQQITQGASEEVIAEVRKSEEYRQARETVDEALEKVDQKNALKTCSQHVEPNG